MSESAGDEASPDLETMEIGYREDGLIWVTAGRTAPTAAAAERSRGDGWRVVADTWLRPTGEAVNTKDDEWEDCGRELPDARPGWKLINLRMKTLFPVVLPASAFDARAAQVQPVAVDLRSSKPRHGSLTGRRVPCAARRL